MPALEPGQIKHQPSPVQVEFAIRKISGLAIVNQTMSNTGKRRTDLLDNDIRRGLFKCALFLFICDEKRPDSFPSMTNDLWQGAPCLHNWQ